MNFSAEISEWEKDSALSVQKEAFPGLHSLDMRKIRSIQDKTVKSTADVLISREKPSIFPQNSQTSANRQRTLQGLQKNRNQVLCPESIVTILRKTDRFDQGSLREFVSQIVTRLE